MKITFLGTGTSTGVPQIGCRCSTCTSVDPRDRRFRASAIVETRGRRLLIDCGPDFRTQILREDSPPLDALLITHSHYDHVGGIDDLRPYCKNGPFPVYCTADVAEDLRNRVPYCFYEHLYPGVPTFDIHIITPLDTFQVNGIEVTPLPVMHGKLRIVGYRIGNLAYITDCLTLPDESLRLIKGVDTLVINALRIKPHMSHMNLRQALDVIKSAGPRQTLLTHISHDMGPHAQAVLLLPQNVDIATDGQTVIVPD